MKMYLIVVFFVFWPCLSWFLWVSFWEDQLRAHLQNCRNHVLNKKSQSDKGLLYIVKQKLTLTWTVPCFFLGVLTRSVVFVPSLPFFWAVRFVKGTSSSELSEKEKTFSVQQFNCSYFQDNQIEASFTIFFSLCNPLLYFGQWFIIWAVTVGLLIFS